MMGDGLKVKEIAERLARCRLPSDAIAFQTGLPELQVKEVLADENE